MDYLRLDQTGEVVAFQNERPTHVAAFRDLNEDENGGWRTTRDTKSYEQAQAWAAAINAKFAATGDTYIATDAGPNCFPRYDVQRVPAVGDEVSYAFNGDSYPDGTVVRVSKTFKIVVTSTGHYYHRVKLTGGWRRSKTWWLQQGHHREQNPHL